MPSCSTSVKPSRFSNGPVSRPASTALATLPTPDWMGSISVGRRPIFISCATAVGNNKTWLEIADKVILEGIDPGAAGRVGVEGQALAQCAGFGQGAVHLGGQASAAAPCRLARAVSRSHRCPSQTAYVSQNSFRAP